MYDTSFMLLGSFLAEVCCKKKKVLFYFLQVLIKSFPVFVKLLCLAEDLTLVGVQRCSTSMDLLLKNLKNKWLR